MLIALLVPIVLATLTFTAVLLKSAVAKRAKPTWESIGLGAVVSFFDTLGIGCFAQCSPCQATAGDRNGYLTSTLRYARRDTGVGDGARGPG